MNLVYGSPRGTGDIDFSAHADPADFAESIRSELDRGLQRAAAHLGYIDLMCKVQRVTPQPREFLDASFPALNVTIGSAERGTNEEARLNDGQAPRVLKIDISFNEPVELVDEICLDSSGELNGYSLVEVLAEKLRALLQQKIRNRSRRQDVYDLAYLIERFPLDEEEMGEVLRMLKLKAEARDITPTIDSLSDPEIMDRARSQWATMQQELEEVLPDFDERFSVVLAFYQALRWP